MKVSRYVGSGNCMPKKQEKKNQIKGYDYKFKGRKISKAFQ